LTAAAVHRLAADILREHLALRDYGRTCPADTLLSVLFTACARLTSLFAAALGLRDAPCPETLRMALLANLPDLATLERRANRALRASLPRLPKGRQRLAIDLTLIPYHGRPQCDEDELYRGQAKSGTTHSHAYATAYLILRGRRVTLALAYVRAGQKMQGVLKRLMRLVRRTGVKVGLLLLDRGFWSVGVIRYLQAARYPFLMPVTARGRKPGPGRQAGGARVFWQWRRGGWGEYTLQEEGKKRQARVSICVHLRNRNGRRGKHGREHLVYACWGWQPPRAPRAVSELYRQRFGIETSYRQMNQCRARTCTRNPAVRLFLVTIALVLRNVWAWLHWEALAERQRGGRRLRLEELTVKAMLQMLLAVAVQRFGLTDTARAVHPVPARLRPG
jgi:putative transposase